MVGAVLFEGDVRYNDMVVWTPGEGAGSYYRKHRPAPFAEYVPLRSLIRGLTTQVDRIGTRHGSRNRAPDARHPCRFPEP